MSPPDPPAALLADGLRALRLELAQPVQARLLAYLALLQRWNAHFNLTAVRNPAQMVVRHLLDSLAVLPHLAGERLVDLGTGAGLPGIPLALARPELEVTLVDSNGKKVRFLRAAVRELGLANVRPVQARVEALTGRWPCVTSRAFASLEDMLRLGGHLVAPGGRLLALKGRYPEAELAAVAAPFRVLETLPLQVPGLAAERHLVIIGRQQGDDCP